MRHNSILLLTVIFSTLLASTSCNKDDNEEEGIQYGLNETYDEVRNGVRLVLSYNSENHSFEGTLENTTESTIQDVRVEVHLSNGKELGPTTSIDLAAGETKETSLSAAGEIVITWSAHAEVGEGGDNHGGGGDVD